MSGASSGIWPLIKGAGITYALVAAVWAFDRYSPLGWFNLKGRTKEEKALAHRYEHIEYPYPGDKEAVEKFLETGGPRGANLKTRLSTRVDNKSGQLQQEKVEREAAKLWVRMKREAVRELQEAGYAEAKR
ncbi:hypothetical protein KFL_002640210 [Klebsormidium nitens]|uniref:Uncharacterized protein n=1 Tax=Klebsormidium nitens TaxID=105231 RepID=A0A0U9HK79_KLENI|nr:hypothetical protein KFL_002640210 [Klebsormidium nitens]|eukprot:GAQ86000.1 hypothetical protein KFL_002640210 [Klebsormidium nitens]